ncbi:MAG TPA: MXAN_2562 family outer membrane beta-barrel protein, partial [Labilithrix sp.]|nr:MXAN_2562 family outer membrane beta-barrel protein [Labilithrix sp.]
MKRSLFSALALGSVVALAALTARDASAMELGTPATDHPFRSAQNFALELRFSPYHPQIDEDPNLAASKPFAKNFGDKAHLMVGLELDWQAFRIPHVGNVGPGIGLGYVGMGRTVQTVSGRTSGDETNLSIYPFWGVAVLRADAFWRDLGFPLVPYGKAGVGVGLWRASNSGGTSSTNNVSGKG